MKNIDEIFIAALKYEINAAPRGTRARLAERLDIAQSQITDIIKGRRPSQEEQRRAIAQYFEYNYDTFLKRGQDLLEGREPSKPEEASKGLVIIPKGIPAEELDDYNFLRIPFRDDMRLFAGSGGAVPGSIDSSGSPVVIHRSSIQLRADPKDLVAFRVGGDSMEPLLAKNGIVAVDTSQSDLRRLKDGAIYALTWDREEECAVKRLRWAIPKKLLAVESTDPAANPTLYLDPEGRDVFLIGRVVWSWREH